jgi:hypothetical protein
VQCNAKFKETLSPGIAMPMPKRLVYLCLGAFSESRVPKTLCIYNDVTVPRDATRSFLTFGKGGEVYKMKKKTKTKQESSEWRKEE